MSEHGDEQPVGVARIDGDSRNHLAVAQPEMLPGPAGVGRLVHPVTDGEVGPDDARTSPHVDDAGIRGGHGDRPDRAGRLLVEDRHPVGAVVGGPPDPAVVEAGVKGIGLAGDAGQRTCATGPRGADVAPTHFAERDLLCGNRRAGASQGGEDRENQQDTHRWRVCQGSARRVHVFERSPRWKSPGRRDAVNGLAADR